MCVLLGFGCDAICPYMVFEIAHMLRTEQLIDPLVTDRVVYENYSAAVERGIAKVMAKMGISTLQSYKGAQVRSSCIHVSLYPCIPVSLYPCIPVAL
jgi:glutamate synthase (NADPH/NADH)